MVGVLGLLGVLWGHSAEQISNPWFLKDSKGQSCASCHSADGIELRGFHDSDILRRISRHHSGATAQAIFHVVRSANPATKADILEFRPMQPDGFVLPGRTPVERDNAFIRQLPSRYPNLFLPINDQKGALAFQKAILSIDVQSMPVGIEFNRLSEDEFHGVEHTTIANWFPDVASFDSEQIQEESRAYLANPTESNLAALDRRVMQVSKPTDQFTLMSQAKFRCLNVLQHELRTGKRTTFLPEGNPFWQIGEVGRIYADSDSISLRVPENIAKEKGMSTAFRAQMKQIRLPWLWLGWTRDPSLTKSGLLPETLRADYFCEFLESDGPYMGHSLFMLTRKLAEQNEHPALPGLPWEIQYSLFLANTPLIKREPSDPAAKRIFRQLAKNSFAMSLYLLEKDLITRGKSFHQVPQASQIGFMRQYMMDVKMLDAALFDRVSERLAKTPKK